MWYTLIVLTSLAGLAMTGAPTLASDCASMRANLSAAVSEVLSAASADPIEIADLSAKVNGADAALKALTDACGDHATTATMPPATAITATGGGDKSGTVQPPSPAEMMERTGRTHVTVGSAPTVGNTPVPNAANAAVVSQKAAALVADLRAAIAANDLAGIHKIAANSDN